MQISRTVDIRNKYGLHARPAMQFVEVASRFKADVRLHKDDKTVDGKSIMELMLLAAERGSRITITAEGEDAREAVAVLARLVEEKFDED